VIKDWSKFNESSSSDSFRDEVNKIRQYFLEFEDEGVVEYEIRACGTIVDEKRMLWSINTGSGNFDNWINLQTEEANRFINNYFYREMNLRSDFDKYPFVFMATIKIPQMNSMIDDNGVDKLEDTLSTFKRLRDEFDRVLIEMNSNHAKYKPVSIKVYFNPGVA
jgi:hypothetical protein